MMKQLQLRVLGNQKTGIIFSRKNFKITQNFKNKGMFGLMIKLEGKGFREVHWARELGDIFCEAPIISSRWGLKPRLANSTAEPSNLYGYG